MPLLGGIAGFVDKYLLGYALGTASGPALSPYVQDLANLGWRANQVLPLDAELAAALVAEEIWTDSQGEGEASNTGVEKYKLDSLVELQHRYPATAELLALLRRKFIDPGDVDFALTRGRLRPHYRAALLKLRDAILSPEVLAIAIVRGLIADPGILPVSPPTGTGRVPAFPVFDVPAIEEAAGSGYDRDRLAVLAGLAGRPMSPEAAAEAYYKGILDLVDYQRAVSESDVRNEWRDVILDNQRFRLSPTDYAGLWLRGWLTQKEAEDGGALYGASTETMLRLYQNRGRPATPRQVRIGYARGARHVGSTDVSDAIQTAVKQSDIRAEWGAIEEAASYSLPSPFVLRQLTSSGAITQDDAHTYLVQLGWPDALAVKAADAWATTAPAQATRPWLARARTSLFNRARTEFVGRQLTEAEALGAMSAAGIAAAEASLVVDLWTVERETVRTELTQAQIVKAYKKGLYLQAEALAELVERGLTERDASIRLGIG